MLKNVLIILNIRSEDGMAMNINVLIFPSRELRSICPLKSLLILKASIPYCIKLIANLNMKLSYLIRYLIRYLIIKSEDLG